MAAVRVLTADVVSRIAAGEVIERPASVVKELVENALDAKARSVEVEVADAGKSLIRVKDSGCGIGPDDLKTIFTRHATSKIARAEDLENIASLGFRGEALYSIAAVSDVTVVSKRPGAETGWEAHVRGGTRLGLKPAACVDGTCVDVREVFFNTPARKKFMRSDSSELKHILDTFTPYTLLFPEISFSFTSEEKQIQLNAEKGFAARVADALRVDTGDLIEDSRYFQDEGIRLTLVLGDINLRRPRKDMQFVFVNGRPVSDRTIGFHMNEIYRLLLNPGVFPLFCVYVFLPASELDVNVHPAKREVKFRDEAALVKRLRPFCENLLMTRSKAKQPPLFIMPGGNGPAAAPGDSRSYSAGSSAEQTAAPALAEALALFGTRSDPPRPLREKLGIARFLGSFYKKYLLFESGDSLLIIDQHAAQERITFEKLKRQFEQASVQVQRLLSPVLIKLSEQELLSLEENSGDLARLGFETSLFDSQTLAVHSQPIEVSDPEAAVRGLLSGDPINRCNAEAIARRACKTSVTAGMELNSEQAEYQRKGLMACADPFICPHGRPTVVEIKESFLAKQFLR